MGGAGEGRRQQASCGAVGPHALAERCDEGRGETLALRFDRLREFEALHALGCGRRA